MNVDSRRMIVLPDSKLQFDPPEPPHNIAVKVINHYGDEVLEVYECRDHTGSSL